MTETTVNTILPLPELAEAIANLKTTVDARGENINPRSTETCYFAYNSLSLIFSALSKAAESLQKLNNDQIVNHLTAELEEAFELVRAIDLEKLATDIIYAGSYQAALSLIQADAQGISALAGAHIDLLAAQTQHGVAKQKLKEAKTTRVKFVVLVKAFDEAPGENPDSDYYHRRENISMFTLGRRCPIDTVLESGGLRVGCRGLSIPLSPALLAQYFEIGEEPIIPGFEAES